MTEILLEVTTEEIRSAALEASQRAKGKSCFPSLTYCTYKCKVRSNDCLSKKKSCFFAAIVYFNMNGHGFRKNYNLSKIVAGKTLYKLVIYRLQSRINKRSPPCLRNH